MSNLPAYLDGKPANLQAAIIDAMYWLRVLRSRLYDDPQLPLTERREHQAYLRLAIQALRQFLPDEVPQMEAVAGLTDASAGLAYVAETLPANTEGDDVKGNASPPPLRGGSTIKTRYCKVCSCELDGFNLAKQGDHICHKCKEARQALTPVKQAKFNLIKEKLRARQQRTGVKE